MSIPVLTDLDLQNLARLSQAAGIGVGMAPIDPGGGFAGISLGSASGGIMDFYAGGNLRGRSFAGTGAMVFSAVGAATILQFQTNNVERLRITEQGAWGLGGANFGTAGQVLASNGPGLPPSWQTVSGGGPIATLLLPNQATEPTAPAAGNGLFYSRQRVGKVAPRWKAPQGLEERLQAHLGSFKIGVSIPTPSGSFLTNLGINVSAVGTGTNEVVSNTNIHTMQARVGFRANTAATTAIAGIRATFPVARGPVGARYGGFHLICRFGRSTGLAAAQAGTLRCMFALTDQIATLNDSNYSTTINNILGVCCDATDANFQIVHRAGSAVATKIDTGFPKNTPDATEMYELEMFCAPGEAGVHYSFTRLSDNANVNGEITTNLPAANLFLQSFYGQFSAGGTSSVMGTSIAGLYMERGL